MPPPPPAHLMDNAGMRPSPFHPILYHIIPFIIQDVVCYIAAGAHPELPERIIHKCDGRLRFTPKILCLRHPFAPEDHIHSPPYDTQTFAASDFPHLLTLTTHTPDAHTFTQI